MKGETFKGYACAGQTIELGERKGLRFVAELHPDEDHSAPWEECDGHGPVSDWTSRGKSPGELVLCDDNPSGLRGRTNRRFYDFQKACRIARLAGWGVKGGKQEGETNRAYAARSARHDFEALRAWCNDEWQYVGVCVTAYHGETDIELASASLWGIECNYPGSDNSYLDDVAQELMDEAQSEAESILGRLAA